MGWKLSKIGEKDKATNTSHLRGRRRAKKHRSAFRNVSQHILKSNKDDARNQSEEHGVIVEQNNQIINLKAPTQFERDDYDDEHNRKDERAEFDSPQKYGGRDINIKKNRAKRRKGKDTSKDFGNNKDYLASFSYFGSRIHDKISEFNKMISSNNNKNINYNQVFHDPRGDAFENSRIGSYYPEHRRNITNPKLKIDVPGISKILETDSSKFMLTTKDVESKQAGILGVAASSVLMGDTSIFTPQSIILPKVRAGGNRDSYSDSI